VSSTHYTSGEWQSRTKDRWDKFSSKTNAERADRNINKKLALLRSGLAEYTMPISSGAVADVILASLI
jgi:hypothetical protein